MSEARSPERLYIKVPIEDRELTENEVKHINRYRLASLFARGNILDIACGSGYGSKILSTCGKVIGVDRDEQAIDFAIRENGNLDVIFECCDVEDYVAPHKFDTIVCVETFEHLKKDVGFDLLLNFRSWLKVGGHLIITTPMLRYKDGKPYVTNPYHINELDRNSIEKLFGYAFKGMARLDIHQCDTEFQVLHQENTGFLATIVRKISE